MPKGYAPTGSSAACDIINTFEPAYPRCWGIGGAPVSFKDTGDFYSPFVRPFRDTKRGNVAEIYFPETKSKGLRELNILCSENDETTNFSFWIKHKSGFDTIVVSVYVHETRCHYHKKIAIPKKWTYVRIPYAEMECYGRPGLFVSADRVGGLQFVEPKNKVVNFLVDDIVREGKRNCKEKMAVYLIRPVWAPWCFHTNEYVSSSYIVSSTHAVNAKIEAVLYDHEGKRDNISKLYSIKKGLNRIQLSFGKKKAGYFTSRVNISVIDSMDTVKCHGIEDQFIVCKKLPKAFSTPIGVNIVPYVYYDGQFSSLHKAGIRMVRVNDFTWADMEPLPGETGFEHLDSIVQLARRWGISLMPILQKAPTWKLSFPEKKKKKYPAWHITHRSFEDLSAWKKRIDVMVKRYKHTINVWEIWNEPDWNDAQPHFFFGTSDEYFTLLRNTYTTIKDADSKCIVVSGGISKSPGKTDKQFVNKLVKKENRNSFDAFGFHAYGNIGESKRCIDTVLKYRSNIPLYMTEISTVRFDDSSEGIMRYLQLNAEYLLEFLEYGIDHWSVFLMKLDQSKKSGNGVLLYGNGAPKEKFAGLLTISRELGNYKDLKRIETGTAKIRMYTFKMGNKNKALLFGTGSITIGNKAASVEKIDVYGRSKIVEVKNETLPMILPRNSIFFIASPKSFTVPDKNTKKPDKNTKTGSKKKP